jgi:hypothetical protein
MPHVVICSLPRSTIFSTLPHKGKILEKTNIIDTKMCVSIFSKLLSENFFILRRPERDMAKNVKYPLFLSDFGEMNILGRFSKNTLISNFIKIRPVGTELFLAERGRTVRQT